MVKGVTRQVIWVKGTGEKLFEQAIFLVKEDALAKGGITEELLLKEAKDACTQTHRIGSLSSKLLWSCCGAAATGFLWLISVLL